MNKIIKYYLPILVIIVVTILTGCKKEKVPVITTTSVTGITGTTATSGGNITDEGSSTVITRGVCWSTGLKPTIADTKTTDGAGAGSFSSNLTGLNAATVYYVRAFATNTIGTGYGMAMSFTTLGQSPTVTTLAATNINSTVATLNGSVNANFLSTDLTFEYGTTINYGNTIIATQSPVTGNTNTNVSANITGLIEGTTYHYRIVAVNSLGTTYGSDMTFTAVYVIGENVNGGIIFYIDGTGQHGLVCAPTDQSTGILWYWGSFTTTGATATVLGTGMANTNTIVASQPAGNYAAKLCDDLVLGGYNNWYLPSKDELNLLYLNKAAIGDFATPAYWSSSESGTNSAWCQFFDTGAQSSNHPKSDLHAVRAIRSF